MAAGGVGPVRRGITVQRHSQVSKYSNAIRTKHGCAFRPPANFPGRYRHLAPALASLPGHEVRALRIGKEGLRWQGVAISSYGIRPEAVTTGGHPWLQDMQTKLVRAEAAGRAANRLRESGFTPDVIMANRAGERPC